MRRSGSVALISFFVFASFASAQVTIQHGNTLSELINNLYGGNGIQLKDTGHSAHFGEGLPIDDHEVLQRLSAECGLDERRVAAVLASDAYADQVRADEEQARSMGVLSTPFVLANGYAAVSGAQPVEDYLALLRGVATQTV